MTERQLRLKALALFARKHWPSIADRIEWKAARARERAHSHDMFHARASRNGVKITFYAAFDPDALPIFKRDANEACRAANDLLRGVTSAVSIGGKT